jgi:hypothetical protein
MRLGLCGAGGKHKKVGCSRLMGDLFHEAGRQNLSCQFKPGDETEGAVQSSNQDARITSLHQETEARTEAKVRDEL